jgi:hypothetical protein
MSEWWTYTPSDLLLFSPRVYYRLLELHNQAFWPIQILTGGVGLGIVFLLLKPRRWSARLICLALGPIWILVGYAFFWQSYATINWFGPYLAPFFVLEGLLLIWAGASGRFTLAESRTHSSLLGLSVLLLAVLGYPLLAPLMGRPWLAAEIFGLSPDPTAIATLAVLAFSPGRNQGLLMVVPCAWCMITGTTLWTMGAADFLVTPLCALIAVAFGLLRKRPRIKPANG